MHAHYLPWNQHGTQKLKVGRCWRVLSFWEGLLSGAMLVLVQFEMFQRFFVEFVHWSLDTMCIPFVLLGHVLKTYRRGPLCKNIPPTQVSLSKHPKMKQNIRKNEKVQTTFLNPWCSTIQHVRNCLKIFWLWANRREWIDFRTPWFWKASRSPRIDGSVICLSCWINISWFSGFRRFSFKTFHLPFGRTRPMEPNRPFGPGCCGFWDGWGRGCQKFHGRFW